MTILALLLALLIERLATRLLHLREIHWLEGYLRWASRFGNRSSTTGRLACLPLVLVPVIPVALAAGVLGQAAPGFAWLLFASIVLVFSLGPRDLAEEVREYLEREDAGDVQGAAGLAREIIEHDAAQRREHRSTAVEDAILVQANNRVFGVLFWFVVLGPTGLGPAGAWLFRVSDLMRRAAIAEARDEGSAGHGCAESLHFVLAWAPARLLALGYALAGSFEDARRSWKERYSQLPGRMLERNDWLLVNVGRAAIGRVSQTDGDIDAPARAALRLARRALLFWITVIAVMSLIGSIG